MATCSQNVQMEEVAMRLLVISLVVLVIAYFGGGAILVFSQDDQNKDTSAVCKALRDAGAPVSSQCEKLRNYALR